MHLNRKLRRSRQHWSRNPGQRLKDAKILAALGLVFKQDQSEFQRLNLLEKKIT